jgi:hypothetical protein
MTVIEKLFDERFLSWRYIAKRSSSGDVIKPLSSLSHGSGFHGQSEFPVNAGQLIGQVFTSENLAGQLLPSPVEFRIHLVFPLRHVSKTSLAFRENVPLCEPGNRHFGLTVPMRLDID